MDKKYNDYIFIFSESVWYSFPNTTVKEIEMKSSKFFNGVRDQHGGRKKRMRRFIEDPLCGVRKVARPSYWVSFYILATFRCHPIWTKSPVIQFHARWYPDLCQICHHLAHIGTDDARSGRDLAQMNVAIWISTTLGPFSFLLSLPISL